MPEVRSAWALGACLTLNAVIFKPAEGLPVVKVSDEEVTLREPAVTTWRKTYEVLARIPEASTLTLCPALQRCGAVDCQVAEPAAGRNWTTRVPPAQAGAL